MIKFFLSSLLIFSIFSVTYSQETNTKLQEIRTKLAEAKTAYDSTDLYQEMGFQFVYLNPDSARFYSDLAMKRSIENRDTFHMGFINNNYAVIHAYARNMDSSAYHFRECIRLLNQIGEEREAANLVANLAVLFEYQSQYDSAIFYNDMAMAVEVKENFGPGIAKIQVNLGRLYMNKGYLNTALDYYYKALSLFETNDSTHLRKQGRAISNYNICNCLFDMEEFDKGEPYCIEAQKRFDLIGDKHGVAGAIHSLGILKVKRGQPEEGLKDFEKAFKLAEETNEANLKMEIINNQAIALRDMGQLDKAEQMALQGESMASESGYLPILTYLRKTLTEVYAQKKEYNQAMEWGKKAIESGKEAEMVKVIPDVYFQLHEIYKKRGDCEKALLNLELFTTARDSFLNSEKQRAIDELNIQYQTEAKEKENALLKSANEIQVAKIALAKQQRLGFGILSLGLLLALLVFLWLNRKLKKERDEKEKLLTTMFHNVKNSLTQLASIFNSQNRRLEDSSAKTVLREGQLRVEAMKALNQQLLMSESGQPKIKLKELVESILQNAQGVFWKPENGVAVHSSIENVEVNYKVGTSIGLVVNELMTNAFKYAFTENHPDPKIDINISTDGKALNILFRDNGQGIPEEGTSRNNKSFGMNLIKNFLDNIGARMQSKNSDGANFEIQVPVYQ